MRATGIVPLYVAVARYGKSAFYSGRRIPCYGYPTRLSLTGTLNTQSSCSYYLLKSEPDEFSIQDLEQCQEQEWDGIRNFQARNTLRSMKKGDLAFFYHSSCKVPGIVGTMRVVREAAPDVTALDPNHKGYDPKSTGDNCRWDAVRVRIESVFDTPVTLQNLKKLSETDEIIGSMSLFRQSRLSVHVITQEQWDRIIEIIENDKTNDDIKPLEPPSTESKKRKRKLPS